MSSLSRQEQLLQLINEQQERLRQTFPAQRGSAVVALIQAKDWRYLKSQEALTGAAKAAPAQNFSLYASGWQKALQLCFDSSPELPYVAHNVPDRTLDAWADQVLLECDLLAAGELVLAYCETGFMRMQQGGEQDFFAWIASKKMPTEWREREDLVWWTKAFAKMYEREKQEFTVESASIQQQLDVFVQKWQPDMSVYRTTRVLDRYYSRLGMLRVKSMGCHFLYPAHTLIGGCTVELYRNVLAALIGLALKHLDLCRAFVAQYPSYPLRALLASPHATSELTGLLAETLEVENTAIHRVVDAYSLSHENVSTHCSVAGTPAPPLLRLDEQHLVWSLAGLLSEPFLFLRRELRRRYSYEYHTASHEHEGIFRQDLYQLFLDKRFVRSAGSVVLRGAQGDLTTDVDALIFDRKTGALALFELKSQDPFAYSRQERVRQRDNFYNAGKQVVACLQWLNRNGANTLLARLDQTLVKRLKVQKTYIFVLGRYLAHFFDGPEFDRRAAWGTWSQVLRLMGGVSSGGEDANPIQALHDKLMKDRPLILSSPIVGVQEVAIGDSTVYVYPDFQAYKSSGDSR